MPDHPVHPDREELAAWQAGALAEPAGAAVGAHLDRCAECAAVVSAVEGARAALASLEEPELPPGLHERLAAAIDQEAAVLIPEPTVTGARGRVIRPWRTRAWNRRAALGTAAALVLVVASLVPVLGHLGGGSGTQQASRPAINPRAEATPGGATASGGALPRFTAPDGYSASALRAAVAEDRAVRDAYERAGHAPALAAPGAAPEAVQGDSHRQGSGSSKDATVAAQQACLDQARAASSGDLRPAFFVDTVYQGRPATVLVTRRAGTADQAVLLAFPRGDCSKAPFASERVQVPAP